MVLKSFDAAGTWKNFNLKRPFITNAASFTLHNDAWIVSLSEHAMLKVNPGQVTLRAEEASHLNSKIIENRFS